MSDLPFLAGAMTSTAANGRKVRARSVSPQSVQGGRRLARSRRSLRTDEPPVSAVVASRYCTRYRCV